MLMFIPMYGILLLMRLFAVITKYTVLDEQRHEAKEGKSQCKNPRSITHGASYANAQPNALVIHTSTTVDFSSVIFLRTPTCLK